MEVLSLNLPECAESLREALLVLIHIMTKTGQKGSWMHGTTTLGPDDPWRDHETHAEVVLNLKYIQIERTGDTCQGSVEFEVNSDCLRVEIDQEW
jgi:hypothetical protein